MVAITAGDRHLTTCVIQTLLQNEHAISILAEAEELIYYQQTFEDSVQYVVGNILSISDIEDCFKNASLVIHLAEINWFETSKKAKRYKYNIEGTANVVNVCLDLQINQLIFKSSIFAIGDKKEGMELDERAKWNDTQHAKGYGWSKHLAEREIWRGANEGLEVMILNLGSLVALEKDATLDQLLNYFTNKQQLAEGYHYTIDEINFQSILTQCLTLKEWNQQFIVYTFKLSYTALLSGQQNVSNWKNMQKATLKQRIKWRNALGLNSNKRILNKVYLVDMLFNNQTISNKKLLETFTINETSTDVDFNNLKTQLNQ